MTAYQSKAQEIIKESIKSAIFIDEKAWMPYELKKNNPIISEEILSKQLYQNFKKHNISLTVHKFQKSDNLSHYDYFFNGRDLVLLDWKLDGETGESFALKLLSEIVKKPHIHFCAIYTSSPDLDDVINNIISFFSDENEAYYRNIKEQFELEYEDDIDSFRQIIDIASIDDISKNGTLISKLTPQHRIKIKAQIKKDIKEAIKVLRLAFSNWELSEESNPSPEIIDKTNKTLVIKNTIITILNKNQNKPTHIIKKLSTQVANSKNSFTQILGIDMQNLFAKKGSFLDSNLLNISKEALLYHRNKLEENKIPFDVFIKDILLEQANLHLRNEKLTILNESFLTEISKKSIKCSESEIALINTFYNGSIIKGDRYLNFGDIFVCEDKYYLCITALCDCVIHNGKSNVKFKYFFVCGNKINLKDGLKKGDGGFISFIDDKTCISWTPDIYIKPIQFYIPKPHFNNGILNIFEVHPTTPHTTLIKQFSYKFTLKQNYAQRIANHAFAHPVRVGVDFVKK